MTAAAAAAPRSRPFARRVAAVFSAKIMVFGLALLTTVVVSRLLGKDGKGTYVAVTSLSTMAGSIAVFGLPTAINYYSAKGASIRRLLYSSMVSVAVISAAVIALLWLTLPWLEKNFVSAVIEYLGQAAGDDMLRLILVAIPAGMLINFAGTILYGRHEVRLYTSLMVAQAAGTLALIVLLVGVFKFGVQGAVWASVIISCAAALATVLAVRRVSVRHPEGAPTSAGMLVSYGIRAYPAGITGYFNYRADTFLIQALLIQSFGPLGLYSMAVTMAELIFYIPDAVSTIFLPMVAGSSPEKANATLGMVSRLTMLITVGAALALIPVAWIGLHLVLPGFVDCMPAFLVLLPGVVSLSLSKVMTSYIAGRGRPGSISMGGAVALVVNLVANVLLIPQLGIVGASLASLLSYTAMALIMLVVACRLSGLSPLELVVPRKSEFVLLKGIALQALGRVGTRGRG